MSEVQRYKFCEIKGSMVGSSDGDWCHASHIDAVQSELTTWKTKACEAAEREAALREELAKAKRVGPPHFCGLPMSLNPHPEAGVPGRFLEVGAVSECIPCLVSSRHGWAKTAGDLQQRLAAAEQRNVDQLSLLHMSKELLSTISLHRTMAPNDWCDSFKNEVANRLEKLREVLAKPTESGASE